MNSKQIFLKKLLHWHIENPRNMPWLEIKDPYKIWISEIILQQTRVAQGWDYYLRFIEKFPSIDILAFAKEDEVLKVWEGLGYYTRARNLLKAAKIIFKDHNAIFPKDYEKILALPGIGPYTAAAISSFAYGLPYPVLDGNVLRVISRYTANDQDILSSKTKKIIENYLNELMQEVKDPAIFNQAIMNFGAMQCTPRNPGCESCQMSKHCMAFKEGLVEQIPFKLKKVKKKVRTLNFIDLIDNRGNRLINKRTEKDIWMGLYQFLLLESNIKFSILEIEETIISNEIKTKGKLTLVKQNEYRHELTHQTIKGKIFTVRCKEIINAGPKMIKTNSLSGYPFPKLLDLYLQDNHDNYDK